MRCFLCGGVVPTDTSIAIGVVRAGVNYRF
jgi:hypothetical protein